LTTNNPVGQEILARLDTEQQALKERLATIAGDAGVAMLTNLVNIGIGIKEGAG
jgi:folate-binding Fe-S cluster repair protein YgfZ